MSRNITIAERPIEAAVSEENSTGMQVHQFSVTDIIKQQNTILDVMKTAMKEGTHYGKIPGCGPKKVLLKAGAEKLCLMFRLAPSFDIFLTESENGHREYRVTCHLRHIVSNQQMGDGIGSCTTLESKYKFSRHNPADSYNTVLKMAKKRALVDAVLNTTAASDSFTQDLEDIKENDNTLNAAKKRALNRDIKSIENSEDIDVLKIKYEDLYKKYKAEGTDQELSLITKAKNQRKQQLEEMNIDIQM